MCRLHMTVLGTQKFDQSAWQMASNQRFLSSLDRGKLWENNEGLALPLLEQRGTQQWSLNDISKAEEKWKLKWETHTLRRWFSPAMPRTFFPGHNCANGLFYKKKNEVTKSLAESELEQSTTRSKLLSLFTWVICNWVSLVLSCSPFNWKELRQAHPLTLHLKWPLEACASNPQTTMSVLKWEGLAWVRHSSTWEE